MRIAIDARLLHTNKHTQQQTFTKEIITALSEKHSHHHFILLLDSPVAAAINFGSNTSALVLTPKPKSILSFKWWYDVKVPAALKKNKADILIATYGLASLNTLVPQLLIVQDLSLLISSHLFKNGLSFQKRYTSQFVKKAKSIAALTEYAKQQLEINYKISEAKINVTGSGADNIYKPLGLEQKEKTKEQYAEGCEYFVFNGELTERSNIFNLLKAFSIFKKWQKTNMKLVIAGNADAAFKKELARLDTYKYRNEVFVKTHLDMHERAALVAGAYAFIYPPLCDGFATSVIEALQCEVPVIASSRGSIKEIAGDGALYADAEKPEAIAEQMKLIFKDEQLRNNLIEQGKKQVLQFNWSKTAQLLWQLIEKTVTA